LARSPKHEETKNCQVFVFLILFFALAGMVGCAPPIGVLTTTPDNVYENINANVLNRGTPSTASLQILERYGLRDLFEIAPMEALDTLYHKACKSSSPDLLFTLSELSYFIGKQLYFKAYYLASSVYAYLYLFGDGGLDQANPYDPRFKLASDLYNRGLAEALVEEEGSEILLEDGPLELPSGQLNVKVARPGFPWGKDRFARFLLADDFEIRGLSIRQREPGLGVPLIALPTHGETVKREGDYLPSKLAVAATAFIRIKGGRCDMARGNLSASVELYSPFTTSQVQIGNRKVPLQTDVTTPLAYSLEDSPAWKFGVSGFFSSEQEVDRLGGLYMIRPYRPGKIPVVFIHGTVSSPTTWAQMLNTLLGDWRLRERYQFWLFLYTTGKPIAMSAARLRSSLKEIVSALDPNGINPALKQMVVIGHSQGGLLTRLMVVESGDETWRGVVGKDFEEFELEDELRDLLRESFFFQPLPFVRRVVFIATPHRGSYVAGSRIGRFGSRLISLPKNFLQLAQDLTTAEILPPEFKGKIPTSVDNMTPTHPFIKIYSQIPLSPGVKSHSIIAVKGDGKPEEGNDGVVAYHSAHIEGVESELVVQSGHSAQNHPLAIEEVRRILLEHLRGVAQ